MKKSKYICPYCGAPVVFERPFTRFVKFLFWSFEIPASVWYSECSERCRDFINNSGCKRGYSLAESRRLYRQWYDAETAGLPDIPILAMAKFGKEALHGK